MPLQIYTRLDLAKFKIGLEVKINSIRREFSHLGEHAALLFSTIDDTEKKKKSLPLDSKYQSLTNYTIHM